MPGFTVTVESDDLARVFTNALAFFPARSQVKTALLRVWPDSIEATATDTYSMGRDVCGTRNFQHDMTGADFPIRIELDREGWQDIEKNARKDKGKTARLEFVAGDALLFRPGGDKAETGVAQDVTGEQTTSLIHGETMESREIWDMVDDLLDRLTETPVETPEILAFDPQLIIRFNKVRTPKDWDGEKILDLIYQGNAQPMLAKVGPSFVGAIMPIDRQVYAENQTEGEMALW